MRAGSLIRENRAADRLCESCWHPLRDHREHPSTWAVVDGQIVETRHPDYRPGEFHCTQCNCTTQHSTTTGAGAHPPKEVRAHPQTGA